MRNSGNSFKKYCWEQRTQPARHASRSGSQAPRLCKYSFAERRSRNWGRRHLAGPPPQGGFRRLGNARNLLVSLGVLIALRAVAGRMPAVPSADWSRWIASKTKAPFKSGPLFRSLPLLPLPAAASHLQASRCALPADHRRRVPRPG